MGQLISLEQHRVQQNLEEKVSTEKPVIKKRTNGVRVDRFKLEEALGILFSKYRFSCLTSLVINRFLSLVNNAEGLIDLSEIRWDSCHSYANAMTNVSYNRISKIFSSLCKKGIFVTEYNRNKHRAFRSLSPAFQQEILDCIARTNNPGKKHVPLREHEHVPLREHEHVPLRATKLNQNKLNQNKLIGLELNSKPEANTESEPLKGPLVIPDPPASQAKPNYINSHTVKMVKQIQEYFRPVKGKHGYAQGHIDYDHFNGVIQNRFPKNKSIEFARFSVWLKELDDLSNQHTTRPRSFDQDRLESIIMLFDKRLSPSAVLFGK